MSRETCATERIGIVTWQLACGQSLTTRQVAQIAGVGAAGAWAMLDRLSRVLPLYQDEESGAWCVVQEPPTSAAR